MPSNNVINIKDFDISKHLKFGSLRKGKQGGDYIPVTNASTGGGLFLQLPWTLNWGPNEFNPGSNKFSMSLKLERDNEAHAIAIEKLKDLEKYILDYFSEHGKRIFKNPKLSREIFEAAFTPILKYKKVSDHVYDYNSDPHLGVKLQYYSDGDKFNLELFDTNKNQIYPNETGEHPVDLIPKGSQTICIVRIPALYSVRGRYSLPIRADQCVVKSNENVRDGTCHVEFDEPPAQKSESGGDAAAQQSKNTDTVELVDSSGEDTDEDSAPTPAQEDSPSQPRADTPEVEQEQSPSTPPPAPKKKRVVRRKKTT